MPACALFTKLTFNAKYAMYALIHIEWIDTSICWVLLILNIPFWLAIYQYLDAIMPSEYGIAKHPCFCFRKTKRADDYMPAIQGDIEGNNKVFNESDPILIQNLTKKFGDFKAVNNLNFSIK